MKKFLNALGIIFLFILIFGIIGKSLNFEVSDEKDDPNLDDPIVNPGDIVGPGNSGSGSTTLNSYIIEVDELPKENIDENAIYKIKEEFKDIVIVNSGEVSYLSDLIFFKLFIFDEKPEDNIYISDISHNIYFYYIKNENDVFLYMNLGVGENWYSFANLTDQMMGASLSFKGRIDELYDNLDDGYYLYYDEGEEYIYKNNRFYLNRFFEEVFSDLVSKEKINYLEFDNYYEDFTSDIFAYSDVDYIKINNHNLDGFALGSCILEYSSTRVLHLTHSDRTVPLLNIFKNAFSDASYLEAVILDFGIINSVPSSNLIDYLDYEKLYFYVPDDLYENIIVMDGWKDISTKIKPISEFRG